MISLLHFLHYCEDCKILTVVVEIPDQFCGLPKRPQVKVTVLDRTFELLLGLDLEVGEEQ